MMDYTSTTYDILGAKGGTFVVNITAPTILIVWIYQSRSYIGVWNVCSKLPEWYRGAESHLAGGT